MSTATAQEPSVPVVFRVWKGDDSDLFALFPTIPADEYGYFCTSYQRVGQHSSADYCQCIASSRPAREAEAADLLTELRMIGYNVRPIKRANYGHHAQCRREASKSRGSP